MGQDSWPYIEQYLNEHSCSLINGHVKVLSRILKWNSANEYVYEYVPNDISPLPAHPHHESVAGRVQAATPDS